nr:unnamed protein product [Digitaria exilis]
MLPRPISPFPGPNRARQQAQHSFTLSLPRCLAARWAQAVRTVFLASPSRTRARVPAAPVFPAFISRRLSFLGSPDLSPSLRVAIAAVAAQTLGLTRRPRRRVAREGKGVAKPLISFSLALSSRAAITRRELPPFLPSQESRKTELSSPSFANSGEVPARRRRASSPAPPRFAPLIQSHPIESVWVSAESAAPKNLLLELNQMGMWQQF